MLTCADDATFRNHASFNLNCSDPSAMSDQSSSPILNNSNSNHHHHRQQAASSPSSEEQHELQTEMTTTKKKKKKNKFVNVESETSSRRNHRPFRACTVRAAARNSMLYSSSSSGGNTAAAAITPVKAGKLKEEEEEKEKEEEEEPLRELMQQCGGGGTGSGSGSAATTRAVSQLVNLEPEPSQIPRWNLRGMWELASVLSFLHVFRHLLNINIEFSAEEFETALLSPNDTLSDIHIPLLKAIPPITRMALGRNTWVTVLCRKLRDWWHWVADGDLPIVASHGGERDVYHGLDPAVRVLILKAICDIRVEQEDIRNYIDHSVKRGVQLSAFRKERVGGDSYGISYWYEDDEIIGHRLYRETRKVELKKGRLKGSHVLPCTTYQWEAVATNFDEFQDVGEILFTSKNRTEVSLGKKLKNDMLPEIEKVHKRKEKLLKKQHREALLLDNSINMDGLGPGRSLRDRKPVTYTFDDFDRSINEAIKTTKNNQPLPEPHVKREGLQNSETLTNGKWVGPSQYLEPHQTTFTALSPKSLEEDEYNLDEKMDLPDRSNRRRMKPQRYSANEFVDAVSDNDVDYDSDDEIVGEAIYDEEYLRSRKQRRKGHSSSEGDDEYHGEEENVEEEEEEEDFLVVSEESDEPPRFKNFSGRTRRETKFRPVHDFESGLRRSNRATRTRINYRQIELSDSDPEQGKSKKPRTSDAHFIENHDYGYSGGGQEFEPNHEEDDDYRQEVEETGKADEDNGLMVEEPFPNPLPPEKSMSPAPEETARDSKRGFLDLNQLAPSGLDDSPNRVLRDDDTDNF